MRRAQRPRAAFMKTGSAALLALTIAGCSSAATTSAPADTSAASGSSAVSADVTAMVEKYSALPTFTAPGDPIDVTSLAGKNVFLIPIGVNPFNQNIVDSAEAAAKEAGITLTTYPNQGDPAEWVQGVNAAITAKADAIVLSGAPDPRALQPQIAAAKAAGIPVIVSHFYDDNDPTPPSCEGCADVTALVSAPFHLAGEVAANWITADSGGKANVLIIGGAGVLPSDPTVEKIQSTLAANCSGCKSSVINLPFSDWNTKTQGEVQSALLADPTITYVYPLYDAMVAGAVPAVQALGKTGQVKVVSYNGSPYVLDMIRDGQVAAMDVGEDTVGIGYATMDQTFRVMLGQAPVAQRTPIRVWDSTNVAEAGEPAEVGVGYGDAYKEGFLKLWGLS